MLRLLGPGVRLCDGWNRREVMRIGGLGCVGAGLSLAELLGDTATGAKPVVKTVRSVAARPSGGQRLASSCS